MKMRMMKMKEDNRARSIEALSILVVRLYKCKEVFKWNWLGGQEEWCAGMRDRKND